MQINENLSYNIYEILCTPPPLYINFFSQINEYLSLKEKLFRIKFNLQGVPKNMEIQWRIWYRLCYELAL